MICSKVLIHKETKNYWTDQIVNLTVSDDGVSEMLLNTPGTNRNFNWLFLTYKGETSYVPGDNIVTYGQVDTINVYDI